MRKCNATIVLGDDYGDSITTFHCRFLKGHIGEHEERGDNGEDLYPMPYTLTWKGSEAFKKAAEVKQYLKAGAKRCPKHPKILTWPQEEPPINCYMCKYEASLGGTHEQT